MRNVLLRAGIGLLCLLGVASITRPDKDGPRKSYRLSTLESYMIQDLAEIRAMEGPDKDYLAYWIAVHPPTWTLHRGIVLEVQGQYPSVSQVARYVEEKHGYTPLLILLGSGPELERKGESLASFLLQPEEEKLLEFSEFPPGSLECVRLSETKQR